MSGQYCITLTTANNETNAQEIIDSVLSKKLAACIQTMPIQSHYENDTSLLCRARASHCGES